MGAQPSPNPFIAWFETLGKGDVGRVGGKNASLGEMVQRLAAAGHPGARRICHDGRGLSRVSSRRTASERTRGADASAQARQLHAARDRRGRAAPVPRRRVARKRSPRRSATPTGSSARRSGIRRGERRRALQRDGRGPARRELRRAAGDLPQRPRRARAARRLPALLRLALHRPGHQLPRGQGLRPHEGRALHRRAADGALRSRRRRRDVLDRHRDRLRESCSSTPPGASARTSCRAGRPGRVPGLQAAARRRALRPIIERKRGAKGAR